jgi:hypothetical protein
MSEPLRLVWVNEAIMAAAKDKGKPPKGNTAPASVRDYAKMGSL